MIRPEPGTRFGRLSFLELLPPRGAGLHRLGLWTCDCGATKAIAVSRVKNGNSQSCGCLMRDTKPNLKHGGHKSPEYASWTAMKMRCLVPTNKDYPRYGGRGISVCREWAESFAAFLAHVGPRPLGTTLDRIDGLGSYAPGNVRWATPREQARNRRDFTIVATPLGVMPLIDYAARIGITEGAAHQRLKRGKLEGCSRV